MHEGHTVVADSPTVTEWAVTDSAACLSSMSRLETAAGWLALSGHTEYVQSVDGMAQHKVFVGMDAQYM